ncbi:hypothetical protein D9M69_628550 [compost metagenome]
MKGRATSAGTTLMASPARTTRSAASKLDTSTRYTSGLPATAASRASISCTALSAGMPTNSWSSTCSKRTASWRATGCDGWATMARWSER